MPAGFETRPGASTRPAPTVLSLSSVLSPVAAISVWHWVGFLAFVATALALDLGLFHRHGREVSFREALAWTCVWFCAALGFAFFVGPSWIPGWNATTTANFLTGYLVEQSLSMDNVFVIALIFSYFAVPRAWQHRVLFWGILGALILRGVLIYAGAELVARWHWLLYGMGIFLVFTGQRMVFAGEDEPLEPEKNPVVRFLRRYFPMTRDFVGERFVVRQNGRWLLTPLALVLAVVETTDVVFAVDSIPAIFGVTTDPYLIFTSNIFAILGLRSLYFVLASAVGQFRHLKTGLSLVLVFIGLKMLAEKWLKAWLGERLTLLSLTFVVGVLALSIAASLVASWRERRRPTDPAAESSQPPGPDAEVR